MLVFVLRYKLSIFIACNGSHIDFFLKMKTIMVKFSNIQPLDFEDAFFFKLAQGSSMPFKREVLPQGTPNEVSPINILQKQKKVNSKKVLPHGHHY